MTRALVRDRAVHTRTARSTPAYGRSRPISRVEKATVYPALIVLTILAVWFGARIYASFIPTPVAVARQVPDFVRDQAVLSSIGASFARVLLGGGIALLAGLAAAYLMTLGPTVRRSIGLYVTVCFGIPSLAAALFSLMVFGLAETGVVVAVAVVAFPFAAIAFRDGMASVDLQLGEMARVYRAGPLTRLWHVTIPTITPYVISAIRNIHALAWKITVVAEVFLARDGIGAKFQLAFENFQLGTVILWLLVFLIVLFGVEYCVLGPMERYAFRWRKRS